MKHLARFAEHMREGLLAASTALGLEVMAELMQAEVSELVGPKGRHDPDRTAKLAAQLAQLRGHLYHYLANADGAVTCVDCDVRLLPGKLAEALPAPSTLHALEGQVEIVVEHPDGRLARYRFDEAA